MALSKILGRQSTGWNSIPRPLQVFLLRGACILVGWKCLYWLWLGPAHQPDGFLTSLTAKLTAWVFGLLSPQMQPATVPGHDVLITALVNGAHTTVISVADACNALQLMVLFAGFVFSVPVPLRRQLPYVFTGLLIIIAANVLRCLGLIYVYIDFPNVFPFAHHYFFTLAIYLIVFLIWKRLIKEWMLYEKK
ncbi:MAG TPA: hypothetical protein VG738_15355 [Chitinophagaceae bacterium]|nr:hypothetical protein [Chitinophagaceae bacterium]